MDETNPPTAAEIAADTTVPLSMLEGREHESLRSPPHLDRAGILRRLVEVREFDPGGAGGYLRGVEEMSAARIGARVIAALNSLQESGGHPFVADQLQMVALNLKNLD